MKDAAFHRHSRVGGNPASLGCYLDSRLRGNDWVVRGNDRVVCGNGGLARRNDWLLQGIDRVFSGVAVRKVFFYV